MGFFVGTERKSWKWGKFDAAVEKCRPPGKIFFDATEMLTRVPLTLSASAKSFVSDHLGIN